MPDELSASDPPMPASSPSSPSLRPVFARLPRSCLMAMVVMGYIPLLHVLLVMLPLVACGFGLLPLPCLVIAPLILYALPPIFVRMALAVFPIECGSYAVNSKMFRIWWFTAQWQILFNRLPFLEELLRLVPGLYTLWLRCWGARLGSLVYFSPGSRVLDRSFIELGSQVVLGVGARLHPHVIDRNAQGDTMLHIGTIRIGEGSMIGGFTLLTSGVEVADHQVVPAMCALPPFNQWREGKRIRMRTDGAA